ncbi:MAG: transglutaminase family protein [Methylococcales bacterium]|nr:transglutaminase family protein [Methylococcales bacterium]
MQEYLESSQYINWQHPEILEQAKLLSVGKKDKLQIAKACFIFVRDEIKHSGDFRLNPITCIASDVLKQGTGYCYAKSHLLAALLRANGIFSGLCYQRLTRDNKKPPFCLHGLNAIYLDEYGWYRVDARGNKPSVKAEFSPPVEKMAFPVIIEGEADLPEIWAEPLSVIVQVLENGKDYLDVLENLPDIQLIKAK